MMLARKNAIIAARKKKETEKRKNPIVVSTANGYSTKSSGEKRERNKAKNGRTKSIKPF